MIDETRAIKLMNTLATAVAVNSNAKAEYEAAAQKVADTGRAVESARAALNTYLGLK